MPSYHYRKLRISIRSLRRHLLPQAFSPTGAYRERVFTGVVAFRVLCHAEIEEYFEIRTVEIAKSAFSQYRNTGKVSLPAIALMSFSGREHRLPPHTIDPPDPSMRKTWLSEVELKQRLNDCTAAFIRRVSQENHGVRERNIVSMLLPVGIESSSIDRVFLSEIDNFGSIRGEYAHKSPSVHTLKKPDPKDELLKIRNLLELILPIDKHLDHLLMLTRK